MSASWRRAAAVFVLALGASAPALASRDILLDRPIKAGDLTFFPKYKDEKTFYYLPDQPRIARGANGQPVFGFILFVKNAPAAEADFVEEGVGRSVAEGFLNFAVELDVDEETKRRAALELARKVPGARVAGPVTYQSGQVFVTSTLEDEEKTKITKVIGAGKAPVMEGHRTAIGMRLTAEGATILRESLKQGAAQLAITFDMTLVGLRDSCDAELRGDYAAVANHEAMAAALRTQVLGVDVQRIVNQLRTDRAYTFDIKGDCGNHEQAMRNAEGQVVRMLFDVENDPQILQTLQDDPSLFSNFDRASEFQREERDHVRDANAAELTRESNERAAWAARAEHLPLLDRLPLDDTWRVPESSGSDARPAGSDTADPTTPPASTPGTGHGVSPTPVPTVRPARTQSEPTFSLLAAYRAKSFQRSGTFNFTWRQATYDTQSLPFGFVPNGLGRLLGDRDHYLVVNYDDPAYRQRQVLVTLDGLDAADFGLFVNHVVFRMTKKHRNGETTQREIRFDKRSLDSLAAGQKARLVYGNLGDRNDEAWRTFDYEAVWSLYGGAEWRSGPQRTADFSVAVSPPHTVRDLLVVANPVRLREQGVRAATVNLYFELFGKKRTQRVELHDLTGTPRYSELIRWASPKEGPATFEYEVLWTMEDGQVRRSGRRTAGETGNLIVDAVTTGGQS